jgi:hypothetical protein
MTPLRWAALAAATAVIALSVAAFSIGNAFDRGDAELAGPGYVQPGVEFWDDWKVPVDTILLGTPIPEPSLDIEGMPQEPYRISAEFLVIGDAHDVMRDLYAQIEAHDYRPMVDGRDSSVCGGWQWDGEYFCHLYGRADDDLTKFEARIDIRTTTMTNQPRERLWVSVGEYSNQDAPDSFSEWVDAARPQGDAFMQPPEIEMSGLQPGDEMPFYGLDKAVGNIPDGAKMLAPSYNPSATYGFAGIFMVTDDQALDELERMASEAASGERFSDGEITAGELIVHHMSWTEWGGGCMSTLDTVDLSEYSIARLEVICD